MWIRRVEGYGQMQANCTSPAWEHGRHGQGGQEGLFPCCTNLWQMVLRTFLHLKNRTDMVMVQHLIWWIITSLMRHSLIKALEEILKPTLVIQRWEYYHYPLPFGNGILSVRPTNTERPVSEWPWSLELDLRGRQILVSGEGRNKKDTAAC